MPAARAKDGPLAQAVLPYVMCALRQQAALVCPLGLRGCANCLDNLVQGVFNNTLGTSHAQAGDEVAHHVDLHH